ncbi:hypothetical protein ACLOJK_032934 [Asimina triloba]
MKVLRRVTNGEEGEGDFDDERLLETKKEGRTERECRKNERTTLGRNRSRVLTVLGRNILRVPESEEAKREK